MAFRETHEMTAILKRDDTLQFSWVASFSALQDPEARLRIMSLHDAAGRGKLEDVQLLVEGGADVNERNPVSVR